MTRQPRLYTIDIGNTTDPSGKLGFVAAVLAPSREAALERLQGRLPPCHGISKALGLMQSQAEYLNVYFAPDHLSLGDVSSDGECPYCFAVLLDAEDVCPNAASEDHPPDSVIRKDTTDDHRVRRGGG